MRYTEARCKASGATSRDGNHRSVVLGALLLECGYLFSSGDDGAALVIAVWTLLCVALIRMLVHVHRPDDENLKLR